MRLFGYRDINGKFDDQIDKMLDSIDQLSDICEPNDMADQIGNLNQMIRTKTEFNRSRDQMVENFSKIAGSLAAVGMLLLFERQHVITSKSLSFIPKPRL